MDLAKIPRPLSMVWEALNAIAPTYLVGGAVRDLYRETVPDDWDLATALHPEEVLNWGRSLGYQVVPTGLSFGTVTLLTDAGPVEVTTFRQDGRYVDGRHPQTVVFSKTVQEDLSRRDFTMNAMALALDGSFIDPYGGAEDIEHGRVATVGDPAHRFTEDPLRMFRAVRFVGMESAQGDPFHLTHAVWEATYRYKAWILNVSAERHRAELWKLLGTLHFDKALRVLSETGLLGILWPEWVAAQGFEQHNPHHCYPVDEHLLRTAAQGSTRLLRLAGLLHDIGKPACLWRDGAGIGHFYEHDKVGDLYARRMLRQMAFDNTMIDRVTRLIRHHMFPWDEAGDKAIRRLVRELGHETVKDLLDLRSMDIVGAGQKWETEGYVRERVAAIIQEGSEVSQKLGLNGGDVMRLTGVSAGPLVGEYLQQLQDWVDEDPRRNTPELLQRQLRQWTYNHEDKGGEG